MTGDESWLEEFDDDEQFDDGQRFDDEERLSYAREELEQPAYEQKQGMSTGVKVLIILLCVGGGSFVLCCGGGIYWFSSNFNASVDPAAVEEVTAEIAEIEIPDGFQPMQSVSFNMGFFLIVSSAIY